MTSFLKASITTIPINNATSAFIGQNTAPPHHRTTTTLLPTDDPAHQSLKMQT